MNPAHWPAFGQAMLALAAGSISVLGFAPFGFGVLPPLMLALLFYLWRFPARPGMTSLSGFAFGIGLMGAGVFWIRISIAQFGGVPEALAVTITVLFVLLMALFLALTGWLVERLRAASGSSWLLLIVPAIWVLIEWLRGWLFTGFPWLSLGYSQIDLPLGGFGPLLGVYGISLSVAVTAAALNLWRQPLALLLVVALWSGGAVLRQLEWTSPSGEAFQVSLLQASIPQEKKWLAEMRQPTFDLYLAMTASVPDSRIVVWPETAVPAFESTVERRLLAPLDAAMREQGRDLLLGIVADGEGDDYYNAMLSLGISGRDRYYKRHLVPFGEYLPFDRWLRPLLDFMQIPMSDFSRGGDARPVLTLAGHPVGVDICYEDAYAEEIIRALPEAAFLINASNDAWFGDSLAPHQHLEIARMRALESGRFLLRATNTGISAVIDQKGRLRRVSPQFEQAIVTDTVMPYAGATPFVAWGNRAVVGLAILMLLAGMLRQRFGSHD